MPPGQSLFYYTNLNSLAACTHYFSGTSGNILIFICLIRGCPNYRSSTLPIHPPLPHPRENMYNLGRDRNSSLYGAWDVALTVNTSWGKKQCVVWMCMWVPSDYKEPISFTINTINWCLYKIRTYYWIGILCIWNISVLHNCCIC